MTTIPRVSEMRCKNNTKDDLAQVSILGCRPNDLCKRKESDCPRMYDNVRMEYLQLARYFVMQIEKY